MLTLNGRNIVIDTGPDFRQQMLRNEVVHLDAILYTHAHKDHIAGMDDVRAFNYRSKKPMEIYADQRVIEGLKREYHYVFEALQYPGIPKINVNEIDDLPFSVNGEEIIPIEVMHYLLPVKAFRVRDFTYITDANVIAPDELEKIRGTRVLVVNSLRKETHISHFNLDEALALIDDIKPQKAYLTHISHLLGKHEEVSAELPDHVELAYDNLEVDLE